MDLLALSIEKDTSVPLYEQIYDHIRSDIITGKLPVGMRLPSKRKLSDFLNVSQTTIEAAYMQLSAEGYVASQPRKGYFVQQIAELAYVPHVTSVQHQSTVRESPVLDFSPGKIDTDSFPFTQWRKYAKDVIDESSKDLLLLGHPHGDENLREEIARYLYHSRGVDCHPRQIIIGSGTEQLMPLLIRILGEDAMYAIEDPGYPLTHHIFSHNDRQAVPIPVDEEGIVVNELEQTEANVVYVTPSHQFPTGYVLSAPRRTQLLNWASAREQRYIIEDDYDSEFRYIGRPIPSLQGMDRAGNVIYVSTFSKSLMPSLRIAYMVLPPILLEKYEEQFIHYAATVPRLDQHILARFMADGHFSRHLNRMRKLYKRKLEKLKAAFGTYDYLDISGDEAGMHITITVQTERTEEELTQKAAEAGIRVYGFNQYRSKPTEGKPAFLIGFGGIPLDTIEQSVHQLMDVWELTKR